MEEYTKDARKEDFLKERYLCASEKLLEANCLFDLSKRRMVSRFASVRDAYCLAMEASMKVCGAMGRDQVLELSTSTTGMFSRVHGGMMSCMERYSFLIYSICSLCVTDTFCDLTSTAAKSFNSMGEISFAI